MILLLILALASPAEARPATRAERAQIVAWARGFFADPYGLRSTTISEVQPLQGYRGAVIENGICVEANARNVVGGYVGIQPFVFVVTPAGVQYGAPRFPVTTSTCRVEGVTYAPFPELGAIK